MIPHPSKLITTIAGLAAILLLASCAKKEEQLHATFDTSMGTIVVKLYEDKAPNTVANFVGLADGTRLLEEGEDPANAKPFYDGLIFHRVIPDFMIQGGCPEGTGMGGPGYTFEDETHTKGEVITGKIPDAEVAEWVFHQLILPHLREHNGISPHKEINDIYGKLATARSFAPLTEYTIEDITGPLGIEGGFTGPGDLISEVAYGTLCMANAGPNTNGSQFFIVTKEGGTPWLNGKHTVFGEVIQGMDIAEAIQNVERGPNDKPAEDVVINSIRVERVKVKLEDEAAAKTAEEKE